MHTGVLDAVSDLVSKNTSSAITLMWESLFSLNLTTAEPDIVYCMDVYDITSGRTARNHLISDCRRTLPLKVTIWILHFSSNLLSPLGVM